MLGRYCHKRGQWGETCYIEDLKNAQHCEEEGSDPSRLSPMEQMRWIRLGTNLETADLVLDHPTQ